MAVSVRHEYPYTLSCADDQVEIAQNSESPSDMKSLSEWERKAHGNSRSEVLQAHNVISDILTTYLYQVLIAQEFECMNNLMTKIQFSRVTLQRPNNWQQ